MPYDALGSDAEVTCPVCSDVFIPKRRDQKYCSPRCRTQKYQREDRGKNPKNAKVSPSVRKENHEQRQRARELAETLFGIPPCERLGFMKTLIDAARSHDADLRSIFTDPTLLMASPDEPRLFHRRCPWTYRTISQAGNAYCRKFWNASVSEVVRGNAPEPQTGEVLS